MVDTLLQFAVAEEAATESNGILGALGIDWQLLLFQAIGFLIVVWLMAKFVYPVLLKQIDERERKINESVEAAKHAEKSAEEAEQRIEEQMKKARKEASEIVAVAKAEATQMVEKADADAAKRSEHLVAEAHEQIEKDILAARKHLERDTLELVKKAASLVTAGVADSKLDTALIKKSIEGAKK